MPGKPMTPAVEQELQRQFNYELGAAHAYLAMALWCEQQNYPGFAEFFFKQEQEEREHARRIMRHLLDRDVLPVLAEVKAPRTGYGNLLEVASQAQAMERANSAGINQAYEAALADKDYPAQVMLQWFINEQVEEEAWTDAMVDFVQKATCAGSLMDLDRHLEKYLASGEEEE
ncbi:MAG: ferritin [Verrucomicrobiae bacterium]|nr:ferritin [Verrucomicrobiae bacterium]